MDGGTLRSDAALYSQYQSAEQDLGYVPDAMMGELVDLAHARYPINKIVLKSLINDLRFKLFSETRFGLWLPENRSELWVNRHEGIKNGTHRYGNGEIEWTDAQADHLVALFEDEHPSFYAEVLRLLDDVGFYGTEKHLAMVRYADVHIARPSDLSYHEIGELLALRLVEKHDFKMWRPENAEERRRRAQEYNSLRVNKDLSFSKWLELRHLA